MHEIAWNVLSVLLDNLIDQAETILKDNPKSGRVVPEIGNPDIRELIFTVDTELYTGLRWMSWRYLPFLRDTGY